MIAYNLWVDGVELPAVQSVVRAIRSPAVRALAFDLPSGMQVSCNLIDPLSVGPAQISRQVDGLLGTVGGTLRGAELVGLIPAAALELIPADTWRRLDLSRDRTVEARLDSLMR
jgi:hypothetical protein